jgi:hypothetical protein
MTTPPPAPDMDTMMMEGDTMMMMEGDTTVM